MQLKYIDYGIDWHTEIFSSLDLVDPEKRRILISSFIAYIDPDLKPTAKGNAFESEFRYMMVNSRFLLYQKRGWEWATKGKQLVFDESLTRAKIKKCLLANQIDICASGTSRLDLQFTFIASAEDIQTFAALDSGTGDYKEYYRLKKGSKEFRGYTLYASEYRIRCYNKSVEVKGNEKKEKWLKEKMGANEGIAWRFEVQIDRNFSRYIQEIEKFASEIKLLDDPDDYLKLIKTLFGIFNSRLKIGIIDSFVGRSAVAERDSQSESAKEAA